MRFQLLDGPCSERVAGCSNDASSTAEQPMSNLCRSGCFSSSVDAHKHDDNRCVAGFDEAVDRRIKVPVSCCEQGAEGSLQCGFEHLCKVRSFSESRAYEAATKCVDDGCHRVAGDVRFEKDPFEFFEQGIECSACFDDAAALLNYTATKIDLDFCASFGFDFSCFDRSFRRRRNADKLSPSCGSHH